MDVVRRYRAVGGLAAWRIPIAFGVLMLVTELVGEWTAAAVLACIAVLGWRLERALVLEVSPAGLARGLVLGGRFLGPPRVIAWRSVEDVATAWSGPHDSTRLDTVVAGREGERIRFSSWMGLAGYRALLADIARRAPHAQRSGLTDELLAEPPARRRRLTPRTALALSTLALFVILALAAWV